jgi:mono/diheme cytochrome c family protein
MKYLTMLTALLLLVGCGPRTNSAVANVSFAKNVQPVFTQNCMPCHSGGADAKSQYVLTSYEGVMGNGKDSVPNVVAGKADSSLLCVMLKEGKMPPPGALQTAQVDLVVKWVAAGAKNN